MSNSALRARSSATLASGAPTGISSRAPAEGISIGAFKARQLSAPAAQKPPTATMSIATRSRLVTGGRFQSAHQLPRDRTGFEPPLVQLAHRPDSKYGIGRKISSLSFSRPGAKSLSSTSRPCPGANSITVRRMTPLTPQHLRAGVSSVSPRTQNTLLIVPLTTEPLVSVNSPSSHGPASHSMRASTCSSRFRCFSPASSGFSPRRNWQIRTATPSVWFATG